jgi:hypothetical protein
MNFARQNNTQFTGKQIPISPSVNCLYPTAQLWDFSSEANFGDDKSKPFKYDIDKCPGLLLD